jgi:hypothetical protein
MRSCVYVSGNMGGGDLKNWEPYFSLILKRPAEGTALLGGVAGGDKGLLLRRHVD